MTRAAFGALGFFIMSVAGIVATLHAPLWIPLLMAGVSGYWFAIFLFAIFLTEVME